MKKVILYSRFERFWHWMQAILVLLLIISGLEIHGTFKLFGFQFAIELHNKSAWALIILIVFAVFWHFTTGAWKQYIPTRHKLSAMMGYYLRGIFHNEPHPTRKNELSKLNPLQRITYLGLKVLVFPVQLISGFLYYYYNQLPEYGIAIPLGTIAFVHTVAAITIIVFVIMHIYLTTTGHSVWSNLKAMIVGWEMLDDRSSTSN